MCTYKFFPCPLGVLPSRESMWCLSACRSQLTFLGGEKTKSLFFVVSVDAVSHLLDVSPHRLSPSLAVTVRKCLSDSFAVGTGPISFLFLRDSLLILSLPPFVVSLCGPLLCNRAPFPLSQARPSSCHSPGSLLQDSQGTGRLLQCYSSGKLVSSPNGVAS